MARWRLVVWLVIGVWSLWAKSLVAQEVPTEVRIGSKTFTEGVLLGEITTQRLRAGGVEATHRAELGGTRFLWSALLAGDLDAYPEYTGTLREEILAGTDPALDLADALAAYGVRATAPLGFNNTYAITMRADQADALGIETISDLRAHPDLVFGFSNEFMDRGDGWPALRDRYALRPASVQGISHDLAYRGLESGALDVTDAYSTDAELSYYDLVVLRDDLQHFPRYEAVLLYRADLPDAVARLLHTLEGHIDEATMVSMNAQAALDRVPEATVAAGFLETRLGLVVDDAPEPPGRWARIGQRTNEHLGLVALSLLAAVLVALPLGIVAARRPRLGQVILGMVGVIYTIPSLALLVFMIPLLGIGGLPAMVALFLYSLLPIVRNTHAGLTDLDPALKASAVALGLTPWAQLTQIELPLAMRSILAGIKTAAVINIGTATLGALIGAGGYGQPILTGIRLDDTALILEGAIPAAVLALVAQLLFEAAERVVLSPGLRLSQGS
ncbi:MAG: glycine betaine ABC transporter substrate-binding protein [Bacteroidota bacterium]